MDLWTVAGIAFGLYFGIIQIIKMIIKVFSILLHIYHTRIWGWLFSSMGFIVAVLSVILYIVPSLRQEGLHEVKTLQILVLSFEVILVGILLASGSVKELILEPSKQKAIAVKFAAADEVEHALSHERHLH